LSPSPALPARSRGGLPALRLLLPALLLLPSCETAPPPIPLERFSGAETLAVRFIDRTTGETIEVVGPRATIEIPRYGARGSTQRDRWTGLLDPERMLLLAKWAEGAGIDTLTGPEGESAPRRFRSPPRYQLSIERKDGRVSIGWSEETRWSDLRMKNRVDGLVGSLRQWARPLIPSLG